MKKRLLVIAFALLSGIALGYAAQQQAIKRASDDPCKKCNIADTNRKCGKCGSHKLWTDGKQEYKGGYLYTNYKCADCGHRCMNKERY